MPKTEGPPPSPASTVALKATAVNQVHSVPPGWQKEEILSFEEIEKFSESDLVVHEGQGAVSKKRILDLGRFLEESFRLFFPREAEVLPGGILRVDSHVCGH
jgi:hypothetical protein